MGDKNLIIFDTDMDTDCDDAGAYAMLLEAHLQGKIELIGVIADSVCKYSAPCCEYIADYYGVHLPIGTVFADDYKVSPAELERFSDYRKHSKNCLDKGRSYNYVFAESINKTDVDYPSAVEVYRKLLSSAEDNSVTVLCVGMLTAIAETLESQADDICPLNGLELFKRKVKHVITMGNPDKVNDFNWGKDAVASKHFFDLCPCDIIVSAEGTNVLTGDNLSSALDENHPLRKAYEIWLQGPNRSRSSWDLVATLYAINPDTPLLQCNDIGNGCYDAHEKLFCKTETEQKKIKQIFSNCKPEIMAETLNRCVLGSFDF